MADVAVEARTLLLPSFGGSKVTCRERVGAGVPFPTIVTLIKANACEGAKEMLPEGRTNPGVSPAIGVRSKTQN